MKIDKDMDQVQPDVNRQGDDRFIDGILIVLAVIGFAFIVYEILNA